MKDKASQQETKKENSLAPGDKKKLKFLLKFFQEELEIPEDKIKEIEKIVSVIEISRITSPYPPPELLDHYEKIHPGFIEKIIAYIDKNQEDRIKLNQHNMGIEKSDIAMVEKFLESNHSITRRSQWQAFIIALIGLSGGIICAFLKLEVLGAAFVGFPLASIISNFFAGRDSKKNRLKK